MLAAVVSVEAVALLESRSRLVERALADKLDNDARIVAERAERSLAAAMAAPLALAVVPEMSGTRENPPPARFAARARLDLRDCTCVPPGGLALRIDGRSRAVSWVNGGPPGALSAAPMARWLADTLARQAMLPHDVERRLIPPAHAAERTTTAPAFVGRAVFGLITSPSTTVPRLFAYAAYFEQDGSPGPTLVLELDPARYFAYAVSLAPLATPATGRAGGLTVDVRDAFDRPLFTPPGSRWRAGERVTPLSSSAGGLRLHVYPAADPAAVFQARGDSGREVGRRLGVLLTLLAFTLGFLAVGVVQLRREHALGQARARFVSGVSHELRTPLAQIRLFAELLRDNGGAAKRKEYSAIIDEESQRLSHLVDNVLTFAALDATSQRPWRRPLDLSTAVEQTVERFAPLARARSAQLCSRIAPAITVLGDQDAMRQILVNLLDNAVKYGPAGQTVQVGLTVAGREARLVVDDQGPGIPPADRERVFEPFFRLPRDVDAGSGGSGIGLAVVRELVRVQGGTVDCEDAPGGGARLVAQFPKQEVVEA